MSKKILIADDDAALVMMLASRLKKHNYEAVSAFDATQVMGVALSEKPDLILLDIKMPAGTGKGALENLKSSTKTLAIPVIVMTAYPDDEIRRFAEEKGAVDFLRKPFEEEALLASIEKALGEDKGEGR